MLAAEPVIAALLALLLELEGREPVFPFPGERPEDALARLRPPLVVLLDGALEAARSDLFFARATRAGAGIVLFSAPHDATPVATLARARGVPHVRLPASRAALTEAMGRE